MFGLLSQGQATIPGAQNCAIGRLFVACVLTLTAAPAPAAGPFGMVSDNGSDMVSLFNAEWDTVTASLDAAPGMAVGDCAMNSDGSLGFSSNSSNEIAIIDIDGRSGGATGKPGMVSISNHGVDLSLSPDDAFLVMAGGGALQEPLSVIDTGLRAEVATARPFVDHTSVEFCDNGTLLVTTTYGEYFNAGPDNALYDAAIDHEGRISLKGNRVSSGAQPNNSACAPGSLTGVLLDREGGVTSFALPDLEVTDRVRTSGSAAAAAVFSRDGRRLYVRTPETVEAFDFDPVSGRMAPDWMRRAPGSLAYYGMEQIALHPDGRKLYTDGGAFMMILEPLTGAETGAIPMQDTSAICFANAPLRPWEGHVAGLLQTAEPAVP
jgi:hypothetical protein